MGDEGEDIPAKGHGEIKGGTEVFYGKSFVQNIGPIGCIEQHGVLCEGLL